MDLMDQLVKINNDLRVLTILDDFLIIATMISVILTIVFVAYITINYSNILKMSTGKTRTIHGMTLILAIVSGILSLSSTYANFKTIKERKTIDAMIDSIDIGKMQTLNSDVLIIKEDGDSTLNVKLTESNTVKTRDGKTAVIVDTNAIKKKDLTELSPEKSKMETYITVQKTLKEIEKNNTNEHTEESVSNDK